MYSETVEYISGSRGNIFSKGGGKGSGKGFGMRGGLFEIAQTGMLGTLKDVERTELYTFIDVLEWKREQSK